jgi:hypothetical protein
VSRLRLIVVILATWLASVAVSPAVHAAPHIYYGPSGSRVLVDAFAFNDRSSSQVGSPSTSWVERSSAALGTASTRAHAFVATNTASLADEGFISPSSVRFSQNSVSPNFSAGGSIDDLAAGLRNGSVAPGDVPQIRIFESNGQWMTLDNRRLVAFQQAGVDVPYRLATAEEIAAQTWKVTTTNGGTSITIRGGGGSWPR